MEEKIISTDGFETIPFEGFANLYKRTTKSLIGEEIVNRVEYVLGKPEKNMDDLSHCYEYDNVHHKWLGIVKVSVSLV